MKISELMTRTVQVCGATDTLHHAAQLMWDHDIGALPVVDPHGQVIGMITDRDACMAAYTCGGALGDILVGVAMSRNAVTCGPDDSDTAVEELMARNKIRRVPVVDEAHRPIGMLSLNDLARTMAHGRDVPATAVAGTLAAICEHRAAAPAGGPPQTPS